MSQDPNATPVSSAKGPAPRQASVGQEGRRRDKIGCLASSPQETTGGAVLSVNKVQGSARVEMHLPS